jgi:hypothetical protein
MIDVTRQVLLFRKLLLCCRPTIAKLDYQNGCRSQTLRDFQKACWEIALERSLLIDSPEVKGVYVSPDCKATIYPSSGRVIDPEAPITHRLVCLPKEEISGMWIARDGTNWHYLDRDQLLSEGILWTEESLENFVFDTFGSWKYFLEQNRASYPNLNDPFLSIYSFHSILGSVPNLPPMDSVSFCFCALDGTADFYGVAKAEDFSFYLKEIVAFTEGDSKEETPKMSEEQEEMVARIGAVIGKRMKKVEEWWKRKC